MISSAELGAACRLRPSGGFAGVEAPYRSGHACSVAVLFLASSWLLAAEDPGRLIFHHDFARNEAQEKTDEPGNGVPA